MEVITMKRLENVNDVKKGDKVFVREVCQMWDSAKQEFYNYCFEYVFEVIRNNPKTLGCKYMNGPYSGGFNWIKGYSLFNNKKEYYLIERDTEISESHYRI